MALDTRFLAGMTRLRIIYKVEAGYSVVREMCFNEIPASPFIILCLVLSEF